MAVDVAEALGGPRETRSIDFQFFTAGSGGAGTTILRCVRGRKFFHMRRLHTHTYMHTHNTPQNTHTYSATFLILSEAVLAFVDGEARRFPAASDFRAVDFGPGVGPRQIFRMNLLGGCALGLSGCGGIRRMCVPCHAWTDLT